MSTRPTMLPYGRHGIGEDDIAAVVEVLRGDWLTTGPAVAKFETALAERVGARHAASCSSGTAALHLAALALGLGPGDAVVVPTMTFLATANAARYVGAEVVFSDVDPETGLMRPEDLEAALNRAAKTPDLAVKAVFPVHLNGQCAEMEGLAVTAKAHGLAVVEDACHALGASCRLADGATATAGDCRHSDMAVFSFHPVKTVAMGEGGAVTTNDGALYEKLVRFRNHGMVRDAAAFEQKEQAFDSNGGADGGANPWYYEMPEMGFNYRASDIHCALGASQLAKLDGFVSKRRALADRYDDLLAPLPPMARPVARAPYCDPAWHLYVVLIDFAMAGLSRATLMQKLREKGVGTQVHYIPVHEQPYYRERYGRQALPGADAYYARALSLPLFPAMNDGDVERVVESLRSCLGG